MKKIKIFSAVFFLLFISVNSNCQTKSGSDFFSGKWSVLVKGTPSGDAKMIVVLEKKDSTMTGVVQDSTGVEISKISSSELSENQVTVYFTAEGYDINLLMERKDEDHVKGSLMGMFEAEGERIKVIKK
jgi:hypothetical protein